MNTCCIYCPTSSLPFPDGGFFGRKKLSTLGPCDLIGTDPNLWNRIWPTKDSISLKTVIASELDKWPKSANEWLSGENFLGTFGKEKVCKDESVTVCAWGFQLPSLPWKSLPEADMLIQKKADPKNRDRFLVPSSTGSSYAWSQWYS